MDGKQNGSQETTQSAESQAQQEQQQEGTQAQREVTDNSGTGWEKQIADRDARIAELEGQVAEAAKTTEAVRRDGRGEGPGRERPNRLQATARGRAQHKGHTRPCSQTTTTTWTSSRRPSLGSLGPTGGAEGGAGAVERPTCPTREPPATRARRTSTGARLRGLANGSDDKKSH